MLYYTVTELPLTPAKTAGTAIQRRLSKLVLHPALVEPPPPTAAVPAASDTTTAPPQQSSYTAVQPVGIALMMASVHQSSSFTIHISDRTGNVYVHNYVFCNVLLG